MVRTKVEHAVTVVKLGRGNPAWKLRVFVHPGFTGAPGSLRANLQEGADNARLDFR
jgi:hypothetical protein